MNRNYFSQCFQRFIHSKTNRVVGELEALAEFEKLSFNERKGVWIFMGELLKVPSSKAHDYFYNTYQALFYDDCDS